MPQQCASARQNPRANSAHCFNDNPANGEQLQAHACSDSGGAGSIRQAYRIVSVLP